MERLRIRGRAGKKCWAWERRRDLQERRRRWRTRPARMFQRQFPWAPVLRAILQAAEQKRNEHGSGADFAGWQYFTPGSGAVAQTAAGEAAELAELHGKVLRGVTQGQTDVWQSRALSFFAAVFSFAGRRAASAGSRRDDGGPGRARNRCGPERCHAAFAISFARRGTAAGADGKNCRAGKHGFATGCVFAAGFAEVCGI